MAGRPRRVLIQLRDQISLFGKEHVQETPNGDLPVKMKERKQVIEEKKKRRRVRNLTNGGDQARGKSTLNRKLLDPKNGVIRGLAILR